MTKCKYCGKEITKTQRKHGEAVGKGKDAAHTDCIQDTARNPQDAYYRKPK